MNTPILHSDIIDKRKERAVKLRELTAAAQTLCNVLSTVENAPLRFSRPVELSPLRKELALFRERAERKLRLFENGLVTICIAGMEKSGKSTMLKMLTGIELPTAKERCTSVNSEIQYTENPAEEGFDILYYTETELYRVVTGLWKYLHDAETHVWNGSREALAQDTPSSLYAFKELTLPPVSALDENGLLNYEDSLLQLHRIQSCLRSSSSKLGKEERNHPLSELGLFVSHKTANTAEISDEQCLIRKVIIHASFVNGCPALRLCDTPGVDDPNRNARELAYHTITEEADVLVVAHRPADRPSPTESLTRFINDLKQTDPDAPLRQRTVYFVNWFKGADPDQQAAKLHIEKLQEKHVFEKIYGPCDVMEPGKVAEFLSELNHFIAERLPRMDEALIHKLENEFSSLQSRIRLHVYDELMRQMPPLPAELEQEMNNRYDDWYDDFRHSLICGLDALAQTSSLPELDAVHAQIHTILENTKTEIVSWLKEHANTGICAQYLSAGNEPALVLLPRLASKMTDAVEQLTLTVETLSPAIQSQVLQVIIHAMGEDTAASLLPGQSDGARLAELQHLMEAAAASQRQDSNVLFVVKALKEFAGLSTQMGYVMRYEMRPGLNLFDHLRWRAERLPRTIERCVAVLADDKNGRISSDWLRQAKFPGLSEDAETHFRFIRNVTRTSICILDGILGQHTSRLQQMVDDFLSQASQTLGTQDLCEKGWKRGLAPSKRIILAKDTEKLLKDAQDAEAFRDLQQQLDSALR